MGMTMTQKILAAHAGLPSVKAGQLINANLDIVLGNDITTNLKRPDLTGCLIKRELTLYLTILRLTKILRQRNSQSSADVLRKNMILRTSMTLGKWV